MKRLYKSNDINNPFFEVQLKNFFKDRIFTFNELAEKESKKLSRYLYKKVVLPEKKNNYLKDKSLQLFSLIVSPFSISFF